ncbi:MAG: hypothetical protein NC429_12690 [Lachnospiraceae bacterium]|nr:hypothetical protein [Lachnospiraceae bacterium]
MKGYPTDEELNFLIERLEEQELYAPAHLKEEIMSRAFPKQTEQAQPEYKSAKPEPITLFTYRLKIVAGMAAALIMLALIPLQAEADARTDDFLAEQKRMEAMEQKYFESSSNNVNSYLNEGTRLIDNEINSWFDLTEKFR